LFDEAERSFGRRRETESAFHFLNRAAGDSWQRVRNLLDGWYAAFPDPGGDVRERFRQDEDRQHAAAWWELYVFTLFRRLDYKIEVHPSVAGSRNRPDFLVTRNSGSVYIECTVMFSDDELDDAEAWIFECINSARNPDFLVDVWGVEQIGSQRPRKSEITAPIKEWLASLDADAELAQVNAGGEPPHCKFGFRDWSIALGAWPVEPDHRGEAERLIGSPPARLEVVRDVERMRKILSEKGSRYGQLDRPLVLALLSWASQTNDT